MIKLPFILLFCSSLFFIACKKDVAAPDIVGEYEGTVTRLTESTRTYLSQTTNQIVTDVTIHHDTFPEVIKFELGLTEDKIILTEGSSFIIMDPVITLTKENDTNATSYFAFSFKGSSERRRCYLSKFYSDQGRLHFSLSYKSGGYGDVVINSSSTKLVFEGYLKQ